MLQMEWQTVQSVSVKTKEEQINKLFNDVSHQSNQSVAQTCYSIIYVTNLSILQSRSRI